MKKILAFSIVLALLAGMVYFASPYYALYSLKSAAEARDAGKVAAFVDFPRVKESLKSALAEKLAGRAQKELKIDANNPLGALASLLGGALAKPVAGQVVEAMVTPENIARMFEGMGPAESGAEKSTAKEKSSVIPELEKDYGYEGRDTFVLRVKRKDRNENPVQLVMRRDGFLGWKLSAVELP